MFTTKRYPAASAGSVPMATMIAVAWTVLAATGASAAPATTKVAEATQAQVQPSLAVDTSEDQANCSRNRRRLWVDGEGWIVRRITTCR